ncbi:M12 family metallo-peptidase [Nocardioides sp.]|uniref:M12 family metallo-peptidase n=1 Tax=Nocardioides sp. TaxID=35761 RepID=UPI00272158F3|nr:M12 family metallo-peptidase [Nocardioides sp.]MDO9454827.1 M12 family metallo-peptidase [Nocardioides sp.]
MTTAAAVVAGLAAVVPVTAVAASAPRVVTAAADPSDVWTAVSDKPTAQRGGLEQRVAPSAYAAYHLDLGSLSSRLDRAPLETAGKAPVTVSVPAPSGELVEFAVAESPVMEPGLAAAHPEITTYAGTTTGDAPASIRLDVTPMGFHASVRGTGGSWYVDPANKGTDQGDDALYLSYLGSDLPEPQQKLVEPELPGIEAAARRAAAAAPRVGEGPGAVAIQRTYRLALITDPSYATSFTTSTDQAVVNPIVSAEKATLMNRVNQVYGDDLSIRLNLVAGNDALNFNTAAQFTGANGRCGQLACYATTQVSDGCNTTAPTGTLDILDQNRLVAGQIIGADAYDIGHIAFGPDGDGGGVAGLGVVGTVDKAVGCTGLAPPTGDGFAIDYVAHEMGHQFSGNHTFNGTTGSCTGGNRNAGTSVEPGSGVSVMAYAGICGIDNLQNHSDPYFSQRSQTEIAAFTRSAAGPVQEIQNIALSDFGTGETLTISFPGGTPQSVPFASYTQAGLDAAVEAAEPSAATATIGGFWGAGLVTPTLTNGFQITWSGTTDIPKPTVTVATGTFTAIVGTTDNGGLETNGGFNNPTPTGNHNPTVTAPAAKTIPIRTPFQLTGSATDDAGDTLVYLWEQNDVKTGTGTALNSTTKASGPLFRIFGTYANVTPAGTVQYNSPGLNLAGTSPTRSFPDVAQVAEGATNQATGSCPALTGTGTADTAALRCFSEFLPTSARTMNFRLTARDLGGADAGSDGGTSFADVAVTVAGTTPFQVTSQTAATSVTGAASGTVTWDVAGTTAAPVSTANVKVSFSTDGGLTYPTVLLASTPNDGTEAITWPNVATTQGRIKVEAVDNYFYDLNNAAITITPSGPVTPTLTTGGNAAGTTFTAPSSDPLSTTPVVTAESNTVAGSALTATIGLPAGLTGLVVNATSTTATGATFQITGTAIADAGTYPVTVTVSDGAGNAADQVVSFTVSVTKDTATVTYTGDTTGATGTRTVSATVADTDATSGAVTGSVAFTDQTTGDALCTATVTAGVASCTFTAPATRIYLVVGTLTSPRYTGTSSPASLVVTAPPVPTLTTGGNAAGGTFTAAHSDPLDTTPQITASASAVDGDTITATAPALPAGLVLTQSGSSADGTRPGTTTFTVTGQPTVDPGTYPVTVTVSDGAGNAADTTVSFTITVTKDAATVTYTGDTAEDVGPVTASVTVADTDATPGTVTGDVAFTDQTTGDALCTAPVTAGAASCTFTAATPRTYAVVGTLTSPRYTGASTAASLVVSAVDPGDTTPPNTRITAGPSQGSIQLPRNLVFRFTAEPGATYACSIKGATAPCNTGAITFRSLGAGSYDFKVVATDAAGNVDPTPAVRRFYVPVNDRALKVAKGPWKRKSSAATFRGDFTTVAKKGSVLTYQVSKATTLALVLSKGPKFGGVDVYLGKTKLVTIQGRGPAQTQKIAAIKTFKKPTSGLLRIVTRSKAPVRIDGLGIRTVAATPKPAGRPGVPLF